MLYFSNSYHWKHANKQTKNSRRLSNVIHFWLFSLIFRVVFFKSKLILSLFSISIWILYFIYIKFQVVIISVNLLCCDDLYTRSLIRNWCEKWKYLLIKSVKISAPDQSDNWQVLLIPDQDISTLEMSAVIYFYICLSQSHSSYGGEQWAVNTIETWLSPAWPTEPWWMTTERGIFPAR